MGGIQNSRLTAAWKPKSSGGAVSLIAKRARVGIVRERSWRMSALSIQTQALFGDLCFSVNVVKKVGQRYPDTGVFSYLTLSYSIVEVMGST